MRSHIYLPAAILLFAAPLSAQKARSTRTAEPTQAELRAQAKVTEDSARAKALRLVPDGTIESSELEREGGKLIYSFDIKRKGKPGIDEVNIDAISGKVVAKTHETPAAEKTEARKEAREKRAAAKHSKR